MRKRQSKTFIYDDRSYPALFWTRAKGRNLIGYCYHHRRYITINQLRQQKCLKKCCKALERFEWHEYWKERKKKSKSAK